MKEVIDILKEKASTLTFDAFREYYYGEYDFTINSKNPDCHKHLRQCIDAFYQWEIEQKGNFGGWFGIARKFWETYNISIN